ncbi:YhfC family intramembrane metalloprotease [Paraburkholderia flava]|uniref:YhfC family intramembrane metalloprotease n=1 Tax=Paraburkholderia flava TaxID=2547393 RepID=UPI00105D9A6B|nr:YhfC family intramembrane metalloprotease [Paraburkholderia flava]
MVVAPLTLICLSLTTLFVAIVPILLYRRLRVPFAFNWRDVIAGIAVFAAFAMVIERAVNDYFLRINPTTSEWLSNPFAFVVYGGLAAGICEEVGRFIAMRMMLRRAKGAGQSGDGRGLAYGIGHGGAEAWLVGVLVQAQWIFFAVLANRGQLDSQMANLQPETLMRMHLILATLSPMMTGIFTLERLSALVFQIGLSVLMWRGVRAGWRGILPLAIVVHAVIDVPAAMFQARMLTLFEVDGLYAVAAIIVAIVLVRRVRRPDVVV